MAFLLHFGDRVNRNYYQTAVISNGKSWKNFSVALCHERTVGLEANIVEM